MSRYAGLGRRLIQRMIGDSSASWILYSISAVEYCDMNASLDKGLSAREG